MPAASITCTECSSQEPLVVAHQTFDTFRELAYGLQAMLLAAHAKVHAGHQMQVHIDDAGGAEEKLLSIRCLSANCRAETKEWSQKIPIELVGAMVIVFHTEHEGHALDIVWGGRSWSSPG